MKKIIVIVLATAFMACSDQTKKVVVMSKGPADINTENRTIVAKDGAGQAEKEVFVTGNKVVFHVTSPAGSGTVELMGKGLYIINVKKDTIIGSYQKYSDPKPAQVVMSQEVLRKKIDSLRSLSEGKNVSESTHSFFILPNHAAHITDNTDAVIVGPYHQMRSAEKIDGKDPEVYRFYSIKEIREMLGKLEALTVAEKR